MYKTIWGKVGEEILKKCPKITQMFDMIEYPKVLKYQLKPLIPLKFKNQSTHSHNPKVVIPSHISTTILGIISIINYLITTSKVQNLNIKYISNPKH